LLWQAKYPFTVKLSEYARKEIDYYGPIEELLESEEAINLAKKRLEAALSQEGLPEQIGRDTWEEVLSFHAALAAVAKSGSLRLLRRLADAEADRVRKLLEDESQAGIMTLARALGLRVESSNLTINWLYSKRRGILPRLLQYSLPLSDYLVVASRLVEPRWRLVNSFPLAGRVYMDAQSFKNLLAAKVRQHIESIVGIYDEVDLPKLAELGRKMASKLDWGVLGEFDPEKIPSCIREIIDRSASEKSMTPEEFYMLVTFLANVNAPQEYVEELLYSTGLVPRTTASVLAEVILERARRYRPYNCETALAKKICSECDGRGPLSTYWRAIRMGLDRREGSQQTI